MEHFSSLEQDTPIKNQQKFEAALEEVENIVDKLGKKVEGGIKEMVAILRAMDLETSSSCAGHREENEIGLPYVELYIRPPSGWQKYGNTSELKEEWKIANFRQREVIMPLLEEFNQARKVQDDIRISLKNMGMYGGFRIENVANIQLGSKEEAFKVIQSYQEEMIQFTEFLKTKFLY